MKKVHIKSYGCQMNVYDSQRMGDLLVPLGYEAVAGPDFRTVSAGFPSIRFRAYLCSVTTCSVD